MKRTTRSVRTTSYRSPTPGNASAAGATAGGPRSAGPIRQGGARPAYCVEHVRRGPLVNKSIETSGQSVSYELYGPSDGELLLLLAPASAGGARDYAQATGLPHQVAFVPLAGEVSPDQRTGILAIADAEGAPEFGVIGIGAGAALALAVIAHAPHRSRSVIVVDPPVDYRGLPSADQPAVSWRSRTSLWELGELVRSPMLIIRSSNSRLFPQDALERMRTGIASSMIRVVPGDGEDLLGATGEAVRDAVLSFLVGRRR